MSRAATRPEALVRAAMAAFLLGSALLLSGCIVVPPRYGYGWAPGHYNWRGAWIPPHPV